MYLAKLAEQAERYDEMVKEMDKVAKGVSESELTVEERNLLSVAYKNVIGSRRASWRIISSIEQKEESKGNEEHVKRIKAYRAVVRAPPASRAAQACWEAHPPCRVPSSRQVESELTQICTSILSLLDENLVPSATTGESKARGRVWPLPWPRLCPFCPPSADRSNCRSFT